MAIKPNINKIGAAPDYSSMTLDELRAEVKRRAEEKMAQEAAQRQAEEAERIRQQRNAEKIAGMANGMTESAQNAVQSAGRYASGWTNEDAPVDAITSAQRNADTLSDYASLFSGELNRTFGSGAASDIYDAAKSTSGYLSDVRSGVRAQRDLYNQYENADDYNADQRLFSMSSDELKKEIEANRQKRDSVSRGIEEKGTQDQNFFDTLLGVVTGQNSAQPGSLHVSPYRGVNTSKESEELTRLDNELKKLNALYDSRVYSEAVSKYGIDPASMTYTQLMDASANSTGDKKKFVDDYIKSVGESNMQTKRAVEWYTSLSGSEKKKLDSIWENAKVGGNAFAPNVDILKSRGSMRKSLVENGYSEEDAREIADMYILHYTEGRNRVEQMRTANYASDHPFAYPLLQSVEKVIASPANAIAPAMYQLQEIATGRKTDVNDPLLVRDRKYETAQNAAWDSDAWKWIRGQAQSILGDRQGEFIAKTLHSGTYSLMDDLVRNLAMLPVGSGVKAAGIAKGLTKEAAKKAAEKATSSIAAGIASSGAGLSEFRRNIEAGNSTANALVRGAVSSLIEYGTEAVGGEWVWNHILGEGPGALKSLAKAALAEGTEELAGNWGERIVSSFLDQDTWDKFADAVKGRGTWGDVGNALIENNSFKQSIRKYREAGYDDNKSLELALGDILEEDAEAFLSAFLSAGVSAGVPGAINRANTNSSKKVIGDMVNSLTHDSLLKMVRSVEAKLKSGESDGKPYTKEAAADDVERVRGALVNARENVVQSMTGEEATAEDRAFAEKEAEKINRAIGQVEELSSAIRNDRTAEIPQVAASIEASIREETEREAEEARTKSKRERAISDFVRGLVYGGTRMAQIDQDLSAEIRRLDADAKNGVEGAQKKLDFANEALTYLRRYAAANMTRDGLESIGKSLDLLGHGKDRSVTIQYDYTWNDDQRNASYNRETNTVTLNPYSPMTQNHVRFVLGHELLHALRADGERGQAIVDSAWNTIQSLMESGQIRRDDENYNMDVLTKLYAGDVRSYLSGEEGRAEVASYVKQGMTEDAARAKAAEQYLKEEAVANFFGDASFWGLDKNGNPVDRRTLMWSENDTERQRREKAERLKNLSPLFDVNAVLSDLTQSKARRVLSDFVRTIRNFARSIVGAKPVEAKRFDTLADAYEAVLKRFDAKPVKGTANTENASEAAQGAATEGVERNSRSVTGSDAVSSGDSAPTVVLSDNGQVAAVDDVAVASNMADLITEDTRPADYDDPERHSITTKDQWEKNYLNAGGESVVAEQMDRLTEAMIANNLIYGYVPTGDYDYTERGPLRDNVEYGVSFDLDASCPRTFQFLFYRNKLQRIAGRPLTYNESMQLIELMKAYGQNIPCSYCYVETKRILQASNFLNWFKYHTDVLTAETDAEAKRRMYSYNAKKGTLSKAAQEVFDEWRSGDRSYTPSAQDVWFAAQTARNSVMNYLDGKLESGEITADAPKTDLNRYVLDRFGVTDEKATSEIGEYVDQWLYDTKAKVPHLYSVFNNEDASDVDERALSMYRTAMNYAKSASSARGVDNYVPYTDQLRNIPAELKQKILAMGGLRKHSSNDFRMDYVHDYFLLFADMALGGWTGHTYTKNTDYVKIFGRTGDRINMSVAFEERGGRIYENVQEGMNWRDARQLRRDYYDNAGVMAMVTSNRQLSYALNADWIDMVIPFHASGMAKAVWYNMKAWSDFTSKQNERFKTKAQMTAELKNKGVKVPSKANAAEVREMYDREMEIVKIYDKDGKRVVPHILPGDYVFNGQTIEGHRNDPEAYLRLCQKYGVRPRFQGIKVDDGNGHEIDVTEHPNYFRLIKETARTETEQKPIQFNFDEKDDALGMTPFEYAMDRMEQEAKIGGFGNLAEDKYGIVRKFVDNFLGKNKPLPRVLDDKGNPTKQSMYDMLPDEAKEFLDYLWEKQKDVNGQQYEVVEDSVNEVSERSSRSAVSSEYDNLYNEAKRLQDEAKSIREKIAELEHTEEYQSLFDKVIGGGEDAVEEMSRYIETSGLSELYDRKKTVNEAVNDAQKRISEMIRDNAQKKEREAIERSGGDEAEYFQKAAVKEFGYTPYFYDAGYLLPNGKLLNLSGEKGKHYGSRGQDHRAIGTIFESETGSEAMTRFMNYGNIRVMDETPGVDMYSGVEPTANQYATIRKMAREHEGDGLFVVDFSDENGRNVGNLTYENRINPERIVNDIKYFYETGNIREQSTTDRFRHSRSAVTPEENARYMELAKDPVKNADELQKMVDEAARKAGAMTLPNGKRKPYYHGTAEKFTVFDINKSLNGIQGYGFYFTPMKHFAEGYGDASAYYLMTDRIATREDHNITPEQVVEIRRAYGLPLGEDALEKAQNWIEKSNDMDIIKSLESEINRNTDAKPEEFLQRFREVFGYDGLRHAYETVLWDNTLIKRADPVTYDDSGNIIPLSERFNTEEEDIRYSRSSSLADEDEINQIRTRLSEIDDETLFEETNKLRSERLRLENRLDALIAKERASAKKTSLRDVYDNLEKYRRSDLESLAEQISDGAWDDYEDLSDEDLISALREELDTRMSEMSVPETMLAKNGLFVRPVDTERSSRSLTPEQRKLLDAERRVKRLKEDNEFLRRLMESGRKAALSPRSVERIVREVSDLYGLGRDERIRTALGIVDKLYNGNVTGQEREDAIRQLSSMSRDMIRDAFYEEDPTREDRERLKAYLKDKTIRVTPELEGDLKGRGEKWGDARNAMRRYLNLSRSGTTSIDSIWEEMHNLFPGYFPMNVYTEADMIERVIEVLDGMEPQTVSVYPEEAVEQNAESLYNALVGKYAKYGDKAFGERLAEGDEAAAQKAEARADAEIASAKQSYFRDMGQQELKYLARIRRIEADAARDAKEYSDRIADLESQARAKAMRGSATEKLDAARKNANYIRAAAEHPTEKKFVPQNARGAMRRLANWIDSITVRGGVLRVNGEEAERPSAPVRGDVSVIAEVYGAEYAELANALLNRIDQYAEYGSESEYKREVNAARSEWIAESTYKLSQLLRSAVVNQNRVWLDGKRRDAESVGGDMIDALNERRGADERFTSVKNKTFGEKAKESASKLLHFWKTNPGLAVTDAYTFWHRIGDSGDVMFDTLRNAQETQTLRNQEFVEAMQTKLKGIELWNYADEKWDRYTVTFKDARGREVTIPRSVAMSVAALWRRMQGREHLENGGFVYDRDGKRSDPIRVGEKSVKAIEDALTEDDKKVMSAMLSFMQDDCTRWGNEATMRRYGFERFTTDNYFRIDVDKFAIPANTNKSFSGQPKIENTSFAKPTREGAGAPVVAGDFIRSVIHHVNGMATYSSYLNAEGTVNQLLSTKGLRDTMQRVLGNGSVKYVEDLMTDLKSQTRNEEDALEKLWSMGAAYYKTAAVAYNLSTALKQPISYTRAAAVMDTKYLTRGMKAVTSSEGRNRALGEMQEFSGTAVKKLNGYSDTGMARDTAMLIGAKKETVRQKIVEFGMRAAEFGDRITWEALWTACREETRDLNPDLTPKELMEATAKRFSTVVAETQVTNSPLDTAPILRSKSVLTRNLFAFWNEPLKTYNLLMRAYDNIVQAKDGAAAKRALFAAARPVASVAAGMILEAAVSALFRSLRDDRDDDMDDPETWKKLISLWGGEMVDNALGVLPYVDQFAEVIRNAMNGYSNTDMGLEVITDILDAAKALADSDGEKAKTQFSRIRALAEAVATAFGIPAKNVLRTVKTIASTALNFGGNIKWQYNFQKIFYNPKNATAREKYGFADLLAKAYIEGDEEAYRYIRDDMIQMGLSPASITKSIVKNAAPDDVDGSSSSLTAYKPGSDGWYLAMGAVYDRATGAPRGLEEEVTRLYEATGDSGVLPGFAPDSFTVDGKEVKIEGEAYTEFSEDYAKRLYEVQTVIRNTAGYRAASDEQKAWWMEKAEAVVGAILKHGIDADYNVTSQGKWIADYLNASDADIAKYIVENTVKKSGDSSSGGSAQVVLTPTSTEFSQIGYDPSTGTLAVTFRDSGTTYTYSDVPSSVWSGMKGASSVGKYYNANVKGKYKSEKAG